VVLHLANIDALTTNLDLAISSAEEFKTPI
jgi:hypothetical protein